MTELTLEKPEIDLDALVAAITGAASLGGLASALNKAEAEIKAQDSGLRIEDLVDLSSLPVFSDVGPSDTSEIWSYNAVGRILVSRSDGKFDVQDEYGSFYVWDVENEIYVSDEDGDLLEFDTLKSASGEIGEFACQEDRCISVFEVHHADGREWFTEVVYGEDGCITDADGDKFDYESGLRQGEKKSFD